MNLEKAVFTTFEAAKICNANISSIKNWIEQGEIDAFRTPGGHYRIRREDLEDFLARHDMPNPFEVRKVMLVIGNDAIETFLQENLPADFEIHSSRSGLAGLLRVGQLEPRFVVLDTESIEDMDPLQACKAIKNHSESPVDIIVTTREARKAPFKDAAVDHVVTNPPGGLLRLF